jgi:hypothetical protein
MRRSLILALCSLALFGTTVARAEAGTVEGTVLPLSVTQEVEVCAVKNPPRELCAVPKADGTFEFPIGMGNYQFEFVPTYRSRMLLQFYDHTSTLGGAQVVSVPEEGTVKGVNADLIEGGAISGTVTAASTGNPLAEVEACAVSVISPPLKSCDQTGAGGEYELHSLLTGYYKVGFYGHGASGRYAPWYYAGASTLAQATPVLVTAGATTAIEPALGEGARVSGTVTAAAGGVLAGMPVCLFVPGALAADRCTESGAGGAYSFEGLPEGLYQVGFALKGGKIGGGLPGVYLPQFYDRVATRAEALPLLLSGSQVISGVDAVLVAPTVSAPVLPVPTAINAIANPTTVTEPPKPKPLRCKKGFVKKKVKVTEKCRKIKKTKSRHRKKKSGKRPSSHRG